MDWEGHESVPPEMWLLPRWCPFHPCRMWCHARMVYLPMGYLWGSRWVYADAEVDETVLSLRRELYPDPYATIDWRASRSLVAPIDDYSPVGVPMKLAQLLLRCYESSFVLRPLRSFVRRRGLAFSADYCKAEDLQTNFVDIGPVNKVYNMFVAFDRNDGTFDEHCLRVPDYLWVAEDGLKMQVVFPCPCDVFRWRRSRVASRRWRRGATSRTPRRAHWPRGGYNVAHQTTRSAGT